MGSLFLLNLRKCIEIGYIRGGRIPVCANINKINMATLTMIQYYESKARAEAGLAILVAAGVDGAIETVYPNTIFARHTPGVETYQLMVPEAQQRAAYFALYKQETPSEKKKGWNFRDPQAQGHKKSGLRNLMIGGALCSISIAIALASYLLDQSLYVLFALAGFAGGLLLMMKGWQAVKGGRENRKPGSD